MEGYKACFKCKEIKDASLFGKSKKTLDGLRSYCKPCDSKLTTLYHRTLKGWLTKTYSRQRKSCIARNHPLPTYSKEELGIWVKKQTNYESLFEDWKNSGYEKDLIPSVDRLDDYKSYSFGNIRLTTWEVNVDKAHSDRVNGINNKYNKAIHQIDINTGKTINTFFSATEASRQIGYPQSNISRAAVGFNKGKFAYGYKWKYKD